MFFSTNLQFLRRRCGITQEQLAQQMGVSRQTISKWESGQTPELNRLVELATLFSCKIDELLHQDMTVHPSPVRILRVQGFRMARYVMISTHAETDVINYMDNWARNSGLLDFPGYMPNCISWGFPYVSTEQRNRFGLQGYAVAYILPNSFAPSLTGPEITTQEDCDYAVITLPEPLGRNPHQISQAIQTILEHLWKSGMQKVAKNGILPCFEWRYQTNGVSYVDIFLQCTGSTYTEIFSFDQ